MNDSILTPDDLERLHELSRDAIAKRVGIDRAEQRVLAELSLRAWAELKRHRAEAGGEDRQGPASE